MICSPYSRKCLSSAFEERMWMTAEVIAALLRGRLDALLGRGEFGAHSFDLAIGAKGWRAAAREPEGLSP
jgi:hypothetical protein